MYLLSVACILCGNICLGERGAVRIHFSERSGTEPVTTTSLHKGRRELTSRV